MNVARSIYKYQYRAWQRGFESGRQRWNGSAWIFATDSVALTPGFEKTVPSLSRAIPNTTRLHSTVPTSSSSGNNRSVPTLQHVRAVPILGSMIPFLSGIPYCVEQPYDFWPEMRRRFGDFYTMGFPNIGRKDDIFNRAYVITDPNEMVKAIRATGKYPSGVVEMLFVIKHWNRTRHMHTAGLWERGGEEWRRLRHFMQTDLLHPESAKGYIPGMIQAAKLASKGALAEKKDLNPYFGRCAFDMFCSLAFGQLTQAADRTSATDPENERFVQNTMEGVGTSVEVVMSPFEVIAGGVLGLTTKKCNYCMERFDVMWEIGENKINSFIERKKAGTLTENEEASYLSRMLDRQEEQGSEVSLREAKELAFTGLFAAVDTTSSVIGWNVFHIARSPRVQEKLYQELMQAVRTIGRGELTPEVLEKKHVPYLHAVIREQQRLTPTSTVGSFKELASSTDLHGHKMEPGDVIVFDCYSLGVDPVYVDAPDEFIPERWLPDAVEARKGTLREIMDHTLLKEPFSYGARKCPGSRVATNEIHVMLAQLVLDWKMTSSVSSLNDIVYKQRTNLELECPEIEFEARN